MALRCLLVGLVASLGFELPSGQDVTSWTRFGRDWVSARTITLADLQAASPGWIWGVGPAAEPAAIAAAPAAAEPAEVDPDDQAFAAINEAMANTFAADFELARAEEAATAPAPPAEEVAAVEPAREATEHESMALAHVEPEAGAPAEPTELAEPAAAIEATPVGRLGQAVRATREAMDAWASLVQAVGREVVAR